jgi:protein-disulfide isomerase/uncharacterized membrane protein
MLADLSRLKSVQPLPFKVYFSAVSGLTIIGLVVSIYLSVSHFRVYTDIGYRSFCAISKAINCDTVSQSKYSVFAGVPVPIWGVIGYCFFLTLLLPAWRYRNHLWPSLFVVSGLYCAGSAALALISSMLIKSYCIMCIVTYAVNFFLLYFTWLIHKRFERRPIWLEVASDVRFLRTKKVFLRSVGFSYLFISVLAMMFFPSYWDLVPPAHAISLPSGLTKDGHPWLGAENPSLIITEYTDYLCFQCKKMHFYLRELISEHPQKIRLVHRHFPMDQGFNPIVKEPFHEGSAYMALLSVYAATKGKFWQANDYLFGIAGKKSSIDLSEFAQKIGLDKRDASGALVDPNIRAVLRKDILDGIKLGITGTPGFVVNDTLYLGQIPPEVIKQFLK